MQNLYTLTVPLCLIGAGLAFHSQAEVTPYTEEMVVTAHRMSTPLAQVGSSISVLSVEDIEASGQAQVADLLRTLPGIAVSNSGGPGKETALRIRGEEAFRTVVYLDGVKISDPTNTRVAPQFAHLMTAGIERIEVLRGPQGMMYGADAGGIVNIISKRPTGNLQGGLAAETGRYGTLNLAANLRGSVDRADYSLTVSDYSSDGFNSRTVDALDPDDDGYDNTTLHGSFGVNVNERLRLEAVVRTIDGNNEYDDSFGPSHNWSSDYEQDFGRVSASYDAGQMQHALAVSRNRVKRQEYVDGVPPSWGGNYLGLIDQASWLGSTTGEFGALVFGLDHEQQSDEVNAIDQQQTGAFVEWQGQLTDNLYYSAGVRHDDNDTFGEHTSVRLTSAYVQTLGGGDYLKYRASYSTGFRAPSLYEQWYNQHSGWAFGEAAATQLQEENSTGTDLGIEFHSRHGHVLEVVAFYTEIDDVIDFDAVFFSGYLQTEGTSLSRGVEINGELRLSPQLLLFANATYNDTRDTDGRQRLRRPRQVFNLGMQALMLADRLRISGAVRGAYDSVDVGELPLDDYEVLSLNASWFVNPDLEFYLRGENVFDAEYREISSFYSSGAAFYGGMRLRF